METGFLNVHDGEHTGLPIFSNHLYDQGMLDSSDTSLLEIMQDDFTYQAANLVNTHNFWDQQEVHSGNVAVLPLHISLERSSIEPSSKEDFQKMLNEWQEHLGTMQASDTEDMDVKDIVELDVPIPKTVHEDIPNDIFDVPACDIKPENSSNKLLFAKEPNKKHFSVNLNENFNTFNLENFLDDDDEEEQKFGLMVAEEEGSSDDMSMHVNQESNSSNAAGCEESDSDTVGQAAMKLESEEDHVDVETVADQIPVLEAGDLKSLLEQFEASEAFNYSCKLPASTAKGAPASAQSLPLRTSLSCPATPQAVAQPAIGEDKKVASTTTQGSSSLHETIRDSLPKEVIERIKASNRRKTIPVIPAMPSRRPGRGATRMQDAAATLSRNKLLKLISGSGKGESIQLDHDYCSSASNSDIAVPKSFYHSNASDYTAEKVQEPHTTKRTDEPPAAKSLLKERAYSRLPEYYVVLAPQKALERSRKVKEELWENSSRKDSGLESGEVSDASEETTASSVCSRDTGPCSTNNSLKQTDKRSYVKNMDMNENSAGVNIADSKGSKVNTQRRNESNMPRPAERQKCILKDWSFPHQNPVKSKGVPMISVLKKSQPNTNVVAKQQSLLITSHNNNNNTSSQGTDTGEQSKSEGPKKRKLNLEEYRSRVKELDRSRSSEKSLVTASVCVVNSNTRNSEQSAEGERTVDTTNNGKTEVASQNNSARMPEKQCRPEMHSVEVQTHTSLFRENSEGRRSRKKGRKYCSQRASSSSSSHSTSSSHSHHHQRRARSHIRTRKSLRRSSGDRSLSSSGSQRSRSRSNSSHSSSSSYSSSSSHSRSRSHSHSPGARARRRVLRSHSRSSYSNKSQSPDYHRDWVLSEREKERQVEERRVIYVGRIDEGTSKAELRRRFELFGPIIDISVHFREHGDNYGFVTFAYKVDAYEAVEHGNDDPTLPRYDLCFGGRRAFCKTRYADLDGMATSDDSLSNRVYSRSGGSYNRPAPTQHEDFDLLLREAQAKLRKRGKV